MADFEFIALGGGTCALLKAPLVVGRTIPTEALGVCAQCKEIKGMSVQFKEVE